MKTKPDIEALKLLVARIGVIEVMPVIAYVMKACGASYGDIGKVFNTTRQNAEYHVKRIKEEL